MSVDSFSIEQVTSETQTGPWTMRQAMRNSNPVEWRDPKHTISNLIAWWASVPPYDPDMEPEYLMHLQDITPLEQEVYTVAAVRRVRPALLHPTVLMSPAQADTWLKSTRSKIYTTATARPIGNEADWWHRCFFEELDTPFHGLVEQQLRLVAPNHPFIALSNSLDTSLPAILTTLKDGHQLSTTLPVLSPPSI